MLKVGGNDGGVKGSGRQRKLKPLEARAKIKEIPNTVVIEGNGFSVLPSEIEFAHFMNEAVLTTTLSFFYKKPFYLRTLPLLYNYPIIIKIWSQIYHDFQFLLCLAKIYFRVNPLYTKHILKRVECYFSHIVLDAKIQLRIYSSCQAK